MINKELTPTETWLLSRMYSLGETDIHSILELASKEKDWHYSTIQTIITHIWLKDYLIRTKAGRRYLYKPKMPYSDVVGNVLDNLFGTSLKTDPSPILNYLSKSKKLKKKDRALLYSFFDLKESAASK